MESFMLKSFKAAGIKPPSKYIDYLIRANLSGATDLQPFLDAYNENPAATPEELCRQSEISPRVIIERVSGQLWDIAYPEANMLLATNHVKIVKAAIDQAKTPEGFRDRAELLKAGGVIPLPRTQTVHFHQHLPSGKTVDGLGPPVLPNFESDLGSDDNLLPPLLTKGET